MTKLSWPWVVVGLVVASVAAADDGKPLRAASYHRVTLTDGQAVTGELLSLDEKRLRLRTAWAEELSISRDAVASVIQPGRLATVEIEDFETDPKAWKLTSGAKVNQGSLLLKAAEQQAERVLPRALPAGRFNLLFRPLDQAKGLRWLLEMEFETKMVRIVLGGDDAAYSVEAPGESERLPPVPRQPGWNRLDVDFGPSTLVVTVDGLAVWYDRAKGPGGALTTLRLACVAAKGQPSGAMAFDEIGLAATVTPLKHPPGDPKQDEVWLMSGDGLFGEVIHADRRQITLASKQTFAWSDVRGLFLKRTTAAKKAEGVQVRLRREIGSEADRIVGVLKSQDEKQIKLAHPLWGELILSRERVERIGRD